jgi:hypothetical protein
MKPVDQGRSIKVHYRWSVSGCDEAHCAAAGFLSRRYLVYNTVVLGVLGSIAGDVTGKFCTKWNERESTWRKAGHADQEVQTRPDRDDAAPE